jgi:MipA family protein
MAYELKTNIIFKIKSREPLKKYIFTASLFVFNTISFAGNWSIGGGGLLSENAYRQTSINKLIIPFISYQGRYVSLYGPFAKLRYPLNEQNIIGTAFQMGLQNYDPNDSSSIEMQQLNKRPRLFYFGPFYRYKSEYGDIIANVSTDVSGKSNGGSFANIRYSYTIKESTMKYYVRPAVGLVWNNKKLNQHFYEVSPAEGVASGFSVYTPKSTFAPFGSLFAGIRITDRLYWTNIANISYIPKTITNSPMASARKVGYNIITGITFEIGEKQQRFNH